MNEPTAPPAGPDAAGDPGARGFTVPGSAGPGFVTRGSGARGLLAEEPGLPGYVLGLGDDALVAAQRVAEWCARAPQLEEDVALANIALDLLGQARALLSYAGELEGLGRDEDALAYTRDERDFRNVQLVELPDRDFAVTVAKMLFFGAYQHLLYTALSSSADPRLAGIAAKAAKETAYHTDHAVTWTLRLGDGTAESHRRMQAAVDEVWPFTHELFEPFPPVPGTVDPAGLRGAWLEPVERVLREATLRRPEDGWAPTGGRRGTHTEAFGHLLAELQYVHRTHPGARW
ncbi:1,2-phenylacetyl-CoA epoxidase subunit PaaC [Streptosporangium pseudovulgare]|uniref:Phenylacetic acid degradation protein n=1 Tax=Streptosporangium pseudovulgare TaxID=35765 RepID=A0ABQ2R247_9ACTN|nr:1,2-phenylacetyl-CoA epoxidase subunit PaaC [Streptosporangium pseudovulgare]GGQ08935.1 phenylacetic acid degradation protein [Streptosporangium pseudovulgare]